MAKKTMFLVDGSNHAFRVQFALPPMHASDAFPTRVLYGFTLLFQKMLRTYRPDYAVVSFDSGKTFRHEMFPDYKGHRPDMPADLKQQWGYLPDLVEGFGYPCIMKEGFEADDVLGALAHQFASDDLEVILVTGDKDFTQLVTPNIKILDEKKNRLLDEDGVFEKYGVPPNKIIDMLALAGDTSDNIPGVRGIGIKTAVLLLTQWGTLDGILQAAQEGKIKGKRGENLRNSVDDARLSKKLVTIQTDLDLGVTLDDLAPRGLQIEPLRELFDRWEFGMVARKLLPEREALDVSCYRRVNTDQELDEVLASIRQAGRVAISGEGTNDSALRGSLIGVGLCWGAKSAVWVPLDSRPIVTLDVERTKRCLKELLCDPNVQKFGHDLKPLLHHCRRLGWSISPIDGDTMLLDYCLIAHADHSLAAIAQRQLGHTIQPGSSQGTLVQLENLRSLVEPVHLTFLLESRLRGRLDEGTRRIYRDIELPLLPVLVEMEAAGIRIDLETLSEVRADLKSRVKELEKKCHEIAGEPFNVGSPKDVSRVLFDVLDLPKTHSKKRKTGWSTDASVLEKLSDIHELPGVILSYRHLKGLDSRYLSTLPTYADNAGRLHTTFRQAVAATGRLASANPNLQNIPIRTFEGRRIREAFVPQEGMVLLSADYSQVELRVLAHYTQEKTLLESFKRGEDIHRRTASEVFGVPLDEVTTAQRSAAKAINFGLMYGMSAFRLGKDLSISQSEAQAYMDSYFGRMPAVQTWIDETIAGCKQNGFVTTVFGRRRVIHEIHSKSFSERSQGEREAVNTRVQGTAADLVKIAMLGVNRALKAGGFTARSLLQVHDELVLEVPIGEVEAVSELVTQEMKRAGKGERSLRVPLEVTIATGTNWNAAHG